MKKNIEYKIRFKAVAVYIMVGLVCSGMLIYLHKIRRDTDNRLKDIEGYYHIITLGNSLAGAVNQAQSEANLYVTTREDTHILAFRHQLKSVDRLADSLTTLRDQSGPDETLRHITVMLREKENTVLALTQLFKRKNPLDAINRKLQTYKPEKLIDTIQFLATVKDTTIASPSKKKFWQRVANVFTPDKAADTVISITTMQADSIQIIPDTRTAMIREICRDAEKASLHYTSSIAALEDEVGRLTVTDQEISLQISTLVYQLYQDINTESIAKIKESRLRISNNYRLIFSGGLLALILVLIFIILIINDVNKGYATRKALEAANERTRRIMESRHQLLLAVSHDIKTPLSSILWYLDMQKGKGEEENKELKSMRCSGLHILAMIDNLLNFSRLEQGGLEVSKQSFNVMELCREVQDLFTPLIQYSKLDFICKFNISEQLTVYSDKMKIRQILINILSNATKYTAEGSVMFKVEYRNNCLRFRICDTGTGIPEEEREKLFQPFVRMAHNCTLSGGSGFGLYVVKGLITLLKGGISLQSKTGKGTTIDIVIPV